MPFPLALIPAIAAVASTAISAISQNRSNKKTNQANMRLAQYQFEQEKEMIRQQNEYNSPSAQMMRYQDAGLNSNLIYSQGNPGNQSSHASYQAPHIEVKRVPFADPLGAITAYQDMNMRQAQIDAIEANTQNVQARTANEGLKGALYGVTKETKDFALETSRGLRPYQFEKAQLELDQRKLNVEGTLRKFLLMSRDEQLKVLDIAAKQKGLTTIDLKNEALEQEIIFKRYKNYFQSIGVKESDNPIVKMIARAFNKAGITLDNLGNKLRSYRSEGMNDMWGRKPSDPMYGLPPR